MTLRSIPLSLAALGAAALLASAPAGATPQRTGPLQEVRCDMLEQNRGRLESIEAPDLHVLDQTANGQRFAPAIPRGVVGINCGRTSVVPAAWDDQVLALGVPLFISETGTPGRLGVLEIDNGRYRFRLTRGQTAPEEQAQIDERLETFQARFDAAQRRPAQQ